MKHRCIDGDRIDLIVLKHYGDLKYLKNVIEVNHNLYKKDLILKAGHILELPIFKEVDTDTEIKTLSDEISIYRIDSSSTSTENNSNEDDTAITIGGDNQDSIEDTYTQREPLW